MKIAEIKIRIERVKEKRLSGNEKKLAKRSHQFREMKEGNTSSLIVPTVSSERRKYLPVSFLDAQNVVIAPNQIIYNSEPHMLGIISSRMHMVWLKTVGGRLKLDYRYSSQLCYNSFPFPDISDRRKEEISQCVFRILAEREKHPDKTLAQLYDPDKMPAGLRQAHQENNWAIERC